MFQIDEPLYGVLRERDANDGANLQNVDAIRIPNGEIVDLVGHEHSEPRLPGFGAGGVAQLPLGFRPHQIQTMARERLQLAGARDAQDAGVVWLQVIDESLMDGADDLARVALLEELPPDAIDRQESIGARRSR